MIDIDINGIEEASFYFREEEIEHSLIDGHHALVPSFSASVKDPKLRRTNSSSSSVLLAERCQPPTLATSSGSSSSSSLDTTSSSSESASSAPGSHNLPGFADRSPMSAHEFFSASPSTNKKKNNQRKENAGPVKSEIKNGHSNDAFFEEEGEHERRLDSYDGFSASSSDTVESLDYSIPSLLEEEEERQILKNNGDLRNHRVVFLRGVDGCASAVLVPIKGQRVGELDEEPELEDEPIVQPLLHGSRALFHSSQEMMNSSLEESESDSNSDLEPSVDEDSKDSCGNKCCFFESLNLILSKFFGKKEPSLLPKGDYDDSPTPLHTASAPLFQPGGPFVGPSGPFVLSSGPFFWTNESVFPSSVPVFQTTAPVFHSPSPIFQTATDPVLQASRPVFQCEGPSFQMGHTSLPSGGFNQGASVGDGASRSTRPLMRHTRPNTRDATRANPSNFEGRAHTQIPNERVVSALSSMVTGYLGGTGDGAHKETNHIVCDAHGGLQENQNKQMTHCLL